MKQRTFHKACEVLNKISKQNQGKKFTGEQIRQFLGQAGIMKSNSIIPMLIKLGFIEKFGVTRWTVYGFTRKEFHPNHLRIIYNLCYETKKRKGESKHLKIVSYWTSTNTWDV